MRIAITGGIGSGKSHVCRILNARGIEIYDCDNGAKKLMRQSTEIQRKLTDLIGPDTYINDRLNKSKVSEFLLASEENKQAINRIVHPAVIQDFHDSGLEWMECAILFEAHLEKNVDFIICITAPDETRVRRIMQRDNITEEQARKWIDAQMPQEEAIRRSDAVIVNDCTMDLEKQIDNILIQIKRK